MVLRRFAQLRQPGADFGNDEEMHRRLGINIAECERERVFVDDGGWDVFRNNLVEDGGLAAVTQPFEVRFLCGENFVHDSFGRRANRGEWIRIEGTTVRRLTSWVPAGGGEKCGAGFEQRGGEHEKTPPSRRCVDCESASRIPRRG